MPFLLPLLPNAKKGAIQLFFAPPMETETRQCRMEKSKDSGFLNNFWWIWIYWDRNCQKKESDWERAKNLSSIFQPIYSPLLCPLFFCLIPPTNPSLSGKRPLFVFPPPVAKRYLLRWNHCLIFRQFCVIFCCNLMQFSRSRRNPNQFCIPPLKPLSKQIVSGKAKSQKKRERKACIVSSFHRNFPRFKAERSCKSIAAC